MIFDIWAKHGKNNHYFPCFAFHYTNRWKSLHAIGVIDRNSFHLSTMLYEKI